MVYHCFNHCFIKRQLENNCFHLNSLRQVQLIKHLTAKNKYGMQRNYNGTLRHYRAFNYATTSALATMNALRAILLIMLAFNVGDTVSLSSTTLLKPYGYIQYTTPKVTHVTLMPKVDIYDQFLVASLANSADRHSSTHPAIKHLTTATTKRSISDISEYNSDNKAILYINSVFGGSLTSLLSATISHSTFSLYQTMSAEDSIASSTESPVNPSVLIDGEFYHPPSTNRPTRTLPAVPRFSLRDLFNTNNEEMNNLNDNAEANDDDDRVTTNMIAGLAVTFTRRPQQRTGGREVSKAARMNLTGTAYADFRTLVKAKQQEPFKLVNVSSNDPAKMINNFSLSKSIKELTRNSYKFDIDACYKIVYPVLDQDGQITFELKTENGTTTTTNLLTNYVGVTTLQVVHSSQYYNRYSHDSSQIAGDSGDLNLSLLYFEKNVESTLYSRVHSQMLDYDVDAHGGPLFLSILLGHLMTTDEAAKAHITTLVTNYNIKTMAIGERVLDIVDLLRALTDTLYSLKNNSLPDEYIDRIINIFTTTSVPTFNDLFVALKQAVTATRLQANIPGSIRGNTHGYTSLVNDMSSVEWVFQYAINAYNEMSRNGIWEKHIVNVPGKSLLTTTAENKNDDSIVLPPEVPGLECFNCKGVPGRTCIHHHLRDCPFTKDEAVIKKNRDSYMSSRGTRQPTRHQDNRAVRAYKYRSPEDHEGNNRVIDGKPHSYNSVTKRWDIQETPPSGLLANAPPSVVDTPSIASTPTTGQPPCSPLTISTGFPVLAGGYAAVAGANIPLNEEQKAAKREEIRKQMCLFKSMHDALA